jgi:hypothetical protein
MFQAGAVRVPAGMVMVAPEMSAMVMRVAVFMVSICGVVGLWVAH